MKSQNKQKITERSLATIVDELEKALLEDKELNEGFLKNAAIAGLLGLTFYTGMELTSSKNTPLGKAMQEAAAQGDEYAEYHLDRLDLYADAGAHKIMTQLSNKYLGNIKDRKMKNRRVDEYDLTEKDEDDPCWDGYEQYGMKTKDGNEVPNCVPMDEASMYESSLTEKDEDDPCWDGYEQYGMKTKDGKEVPNCVPVSESSLTEEETLLAAMKDSTVAESAGMTPKEARASLRSKYGYDDLAIARAQLDETTSAGSVATVSAPIGDTKKRNMSEEEMGNKDSDFDSAWFVKTEADDVEGPFDSKKAASGSAKGREEWVKQGKDITGGERRLAKRANILSSTVLESNLVGEYEKKFRKQLNESMGVSVNVDSDQPDSKNITVTASGEDADELAGLLANAGLFSSPGYGEVQFQEPESEPTSSCGCGSASEMAMEEEGEYSNSPEEKYQDMEYMLNVVSGGLNREKNSYDKAEDGDNPMAVVREEGDTAVGMFVNMDEFYSYVLDFYGTNGIYDIGATEEEVKKATELVKNEVGDEFEGDSFDREKVRDVILDQMRSEEERKEAEKAFAPKEEVDSDGGVGLVTGDELSEVKKLAGLQEESDDEESRRQSMPKSMPNWLVKQFEKRAENERRAGGMIDIDNMLPTVAVELSDGSEYFFQEHEAQDLIDQVPENISPEDFILATAQNW